jgi:hypothetical protein
MKYRLIENGNGEYVIQEQCDSCIDTDEWCTCSHHGTDLKRASKRLATLRQADESKKLSSKVVRIIE